MFKGKFITVYGVNNIGKSTHAIKLRDRLIKEGYDAVHIKYPIYDLSPTGPYLNQILRKSGNQPISEEELQMWFTLNRHQYEPTLKKMLDEGKTVIAEDYIGTGIAWGVTKGASQQWLEELNKYLLRSHFSLLIDGERTVEATEKGHIHETNEPLLHKARITLQNLAKQYSWEVIPLQQKKKDTADLIWQAIVRFFG